MESDVPTSDLFDILKSFYLVSDKFELLQMLNTLLLKIVAALLVVLTALDEPQIIGKELGTSLVPTEVFGDDFSMVARFKIAPVTVVGLTYSVDHTLDVVLTMSSFHLTVCVATLRDLQVLALLVAGIPGCIDCCHALALHRILGRRLLLPSRSMSLILWS